jgi:hypothetical protein
MRLGEVIAMLERADKNLVLLWGFGAPHSYRGYYDQLAFTPQTGCAVESMLKHALSAKGCTFHGYKGGEYLMDSSTPVWIANHGSLGVELNKELLALMLETGHE